MRARISVVICAGLLSCVAVGIARAQDPVPLDSKRSDPRLPSALTGQADTGEMLDVAYLAKVRRGSKVTLLLMSGSRISGLLASVKDETGVIVLQLSGDRLGCYKPAAIEGVEFAR